ncbi:unnamed protein product [Trichobilharzia regenti]|nr:unnamed protein product [Trichobilharzia regenti]
MNSVQSVVQECVELGIKSSTVNNKQVSCAQKSSTVLATKKISEDEEEVEAVFEEIQDSFDIPIDQCSDPDQMMLIGGSLAKNISIDNELIQSMKDCRNSQMYMKMLESRRRLPAYQIKEDVVSTVQNNQVVIISGETGCGKTTQVPQFILEDQVLKGNGSVTRIVVTQPRPERGESIGSSVGYQIRLERRYPQRPHGSILFCTTGIILQWFRSDPLLKNISHIIVDEVHEHNCPKFEIPGKTFPVKTYYLEDILKETKFWLPNTAMNKLKRNQASTLKQRLLKSNIPKKEALKRSYGKTPEFSRWLQSLNG